ncbi:hypothetical protein [Rugamonas rivuli]|uniref:Uncharacterized protein n=1 Tax=Rugamonas rivuli TaxID=2743358 RepID=A0A843SG36_9BURK|nr:hypothetical protein [Rugamonas rivuli]MQA21163.1 hypothetical protein [Rugamonas rivuli]
MWEFCGQRPVFPLGKSLTMGGFHGTHRGIFPEVQALRRTERGKTQRRSWSLAAASNVARIDALSQQVERLRQTKLSSAEELAAILEPLAQAMAALTDETRASLVQSNQRSLQCSIFFEESQF